MGTRVQDMGIRDGTFGFENRCKTWVQGVQDKNTWGCKTKVKDNGTKHGCKRSKKWVQGLQDMDAKVHNRGARSTRVLEGNPVPAGATNPSHGVPQSQLGGNPVPARGTPVLTGVPLERTWD